MRSILLAAVAATCFATPAFAQEESPFTGFRLEALGGYDSLSFDVDDSEDDSEDDATTANGLAYGIGAGYDLQLGQAVVGIEAEFGDATGKFGAGDDDVASAIHTGRDLYVGARAGYLVAPKTLLYVKGGYTNARITADGEDIDGADIADIIDELDLDLDIGEADLSGAEARLSMDGFRLGAGIEHAFSSMMYAKVEYRYSQYSANKLEVEYDGEEASIELDDANLDLNRHQVLVGLGVRF